MDSLIDGNLEIRKITEKDLPELWALAFKDKNPEWKKWDAPYFEHEALSYENFLYQKYDYLNQPSRQAVLVDGEFIGIVTYYYEDEMKKWLEVGIVLYAGKQWGKGIGTRVLRLWIDHLFSQVDLPRIGLTTWSGNARMMRVAEKLGMTMEARVRKVRYYDGEYYDSIRMGVLREEWEPVE